MTGKELLIGLSFVDEKFIAEADQLTRRNTPWMKILSAAACLCVLMFGVYAMSQNKSAMEAAAPAAPAMTESAVEEAAPAATEAAPKQESVTAEPEAPAPVEEEMASGELQHVPYAKLRVVNILEDGKFEAIAEATEEMEADTLVTVVVDPDKVPNADRQITNDLSVITVDAVFEIYDGAYDAGENTLYVAQLHY